MVQSQIDFDAELGRILRDEGMAQVSENAGEWKDIAGQMLDAWIDTVYPNEEFTGEYVRRYLEEHDCPAPHHPNAWSAVIGGRLRKWLKAGRIKIEGWQQSSSPQAHARRVVLYKKVGYE